MATWEQINFQNSYTPLMEQFIFLHDHIMSILLMITVLVSYIMVKFFNQKLFNNMSLENHKLEILWTFLPGLILILIALPSLRLLYLSEEIYNLPINIKTMGHQWYWSYEYSDFKNLDFDAFMKSEQTSSLFRLLDTDNQTVLPTKTPIQMFVSSTDVLHAWTIPTLGVKADSTPGRLNIINIVSLKSGLFFGQCSEICGSNHSFMPIVLETRPLKTFKTWIYSSLK